MIADLDTLLVALYVELTDHIIPSLRPRQGPGRPPLVSDAEVVCLAVAQVLLRYHDERHWLRAAPSRVGHLFPGCCRSPSTTAGCARSPGCWRPRCAGWPTTPSHRRVAATCGWHRGGVRPLADHRRPLGAVRLRRLRPRHLAPLLLLGRPAAAGHHLRGDGDRVRAGQPKLYGEREHARLLVATHPANRPPEGSAVVTDKGLSGTEEFFAGLGVCLVRPARADEPDPGVFPGWLRQRIEAIIWTLKHSSAWAVPAAASQGGCGYGWCSACSPATPRSGSTG